MEYTTMKIPKTVRDELKEERLPHENNFGETIERLLGGSHGGQLWTEKEIRDIVTDEIDRVQRR